MTAPILRLRDVSVLLGGSRSWCRRRGPSTASAWTFISHDLSVVERLSDRVAIRLRGRIVGTAPTAEVFDRRVHP